MGNSAMMQVLLHLLLSDDIRKQNGRILDGLQVLSEIKPEYELMVEMDVGTKTYLETAQKLMTEQAQVSKDILDTLSKLDGKFPVFDKPEALASLTSRLDVLERAINAQNDKLH